MKSSSALRFFICAIISGSFNVLAKASRSGVTGSGGARPDLRDQLLLAARQRGGLAGRAVAQGERPRRRVARLAEQFGGGQVQRQQDVARSRELGRQVGRLEHERETVQSKGGEG